LRKGKCWCVMLLLLKTRVFVLVLARKREADFQVALFGKAREDGPLAPSPFTDITEFGNFAF
jgi:hypothetical protein